MTPAARVWGNDLRNLVRDRTVGALVVLPFVFLVLLRVGLPPLEGFVPALAGYRPFALALFCIIAGMVPAFMLAFLMLDEKDQDLFAVFRVLPLPRGAMASYRLAMVAALGFASSLLLVAGTGWAGRSPPALVALPALCALGAAVSLLVAVTLAANKIEGLALFKGLFFLAALALPGAATAEPWSPLFAVLPFYWTYRAFAAADPAALLAAAAVGAAFHLLVGALFHRRFRRLL